MPDAVPVIAPCDARLPLLLASCLTAPVTRESAIALAFAWTPLPSALGLTSEACSTLRFFVAGASSALRAGVGVDVAEALPRAEWETRQYGR